MTERVKVTKQKRKYKETLGKGGKVDVFKNSDDLDEVIAAQLEKDKHTRKYPLKINKQTTIFVSKDKCNEQYAEQYRKKIEASIKNGTSSLSKYDRVKVTACASLTFINDILTQSVMDLIQMAKNLGIYKHRRKQFLNLMMTEIKKYEHFMFVESGEKIDQRACQCEAFMEQVEESKQRLLTEAEKVLTDGEVPYSSYLSYIHLTRATCMAAEIAIKGWSKKLVATAYPKRSDYNMNIFRQKNFEIRLQQLVTFEFGPYQDRKKESEESVNATKAYLQKLTDTDMICRIIGGQIKPSWVVEDEKKAEEEANKSKEEEPNKTEEDSVIKE